MDTDSSSAVVIIYNTRSSNRAIRPNFSTTTEQCSVGMVNTAKQTKPSRAGCACQVSGCVVALRYDSIDDTSSVPEVCSIIVVVTGGKRHRHTFQPWHENEALVSHRVSCIVWHHAPTYHVDIFSPVGCDRNSTTRCTCTIGSKTA